MSRDFIFRMTYKLAVETLFFGILFGFGFMLSEMILPGFLSDHLHYFFIYTLVVGLLASIVALYTQIPREGNELSSKYIYPRPLFLIAGAGIALFLAVASSNLSGFPLVSLMTLTGVTIVLLLRSMLVEEKKGMSREEDSLVIKYQDE